MKRIAIYILGVLLLTQCSSDDAMVEGDYLIFGHFYGFCVGETCVETFKLTSDQLFEDELDDYRGEKFSFNALSSEEFEIAQGLYESFPAQLFLEQDEFIGCPDCADGGGIFIELSRDGAKRRWRIDQFKSSVPESLHDYMDQVNETIAALNE